MATCGLDLRFGVAQFDRYDPLADIAKLEMWGFDYCEPAVVNVMALGDAEFQKVLRKVAASGIRVECMNCFLPADLRVVGNDVNQARLKDYVRRSLARAQAFGTQVVSFGSGDARTVPEGFSKGQAWVQLQDFLRIAGDEILQCRYGMVIAIEPLRKAESNIVNTAAEAHELAVQTNHPKIRMMVDFFHMASEREDPASLRHMLDYIVHFHLSDTSGGRTFPKPESENLTFRQYFSILRATGYRGRLSLEANTDNFDADAPAGLAAVRKLYVDVSSPDFLT
jgi:sugar phosphate isomerase/epimerase